MNKQLTNKIVVLFAFSAITSFSLQPLSEKTAKYGSIAGGTVAGVATGLVAYYGCLRNSSDQNIKTLLSVFPATGVGGLTWWLLDKYLFTLTPQGKCLAAEKMLQVLALNSIMTKTFESADHFYNHVSTEFGSDWLFAAKNHLNLMSNNRFDVQLLIHEILSETLNVSEYTDVIEKCKNMKEKIHMFLLQIKQLTNYITIKEAEQTIQQITLDAIMTKNFESADHFYKHINITFDTNWPLVLAKNHLMSIVTKLSHIQEHMQSMLTEISENIKYADIAEKCKNITEKAQKLSSKTEQLIDCITQSAHYDFQIKLHEDYLEAERKRKHELKLKHKDHVEAERRRDHEQKLKLEDLSHQSWEKEQDRKLKKELAQGNNRPILVSV